VGKANVSRQALVEAIAALEAEHGSAGDATELIRAVDIALRALREELAELQAHPNDENRRQLTVLVADLSGFTALSEGMDVDNVRQAINAMWRVLDAVIDAWGGQIDQHAGDSLIALFGLPRPRGGDASRALHAALAMQRELQLFNDRVSREVERLAGESWAGDWPGPDMRIGVHSGPVYFARSATGGRASVATRPTAVGDTIAVARRLEKQAPAGGVLTSDVVYRRAQSRFYMRPFLGGDAANLEDESSYLATGEKAEAASFAPGLVAGQATRLVGRTEQIDDLELALQSVIESGAPQLVTLVGPPGVGKSRLVYEFESRADLLTGSITVLRATTRGQPADSPYALARDLLLGHMGIRPQHSSYLVEEKLREAIADLNRPETRGRSAQTLELFEQILDVKASAMIPVDDVLAVVEPLIRTVTHDGPALVILEGIDRADRQSLELVERLARGEIAAPVLLLGIAGDEAPEEVIPWLADDDVFSPFRCLNVPSLSAVESRLMATQILSPLSPPSMRLLDLIVAESAGNPLYIEAFIRLLIERGAIVIGERWRVDMAAIEAFRLPVGLHQLMAARLAQLPEIEQTILRRAAIWGTYCWDTALIEMRGASAIDGSLVEGALSSLESQRYLTRVDAYSFAASQAYAFRRDCVREAAYKGIPAAERRALHLEAAQWLIANQDVPRFANWFPIHDMIAHHFDLAGNGAQAGAWRRTAIAVPA
jgi:class 3 adenylate cyclase